MPSEIVFKKKLSKYECKHHIIRSLLLVKFFKDESISFEAGGQMFKANLDRFGRLFVGVEVFQKLGITDEEKTVVFENYGKSNRLFTEKVAWEALSH